MAQSIKLSCVVFVYLFIQQTFAGAVDGGGGRGVVCRDKQGTITSAELLDFYEAKLMWGKKISRSNLPVEQQLTEVLTQNPHLNTTIGPLIEFVQEKLNILPDDVKLTPIDDSLEIILPKNCQVEQLANFVNNNLILVDGEIWHQLSNTDKAGLIFHEAIYWRERSFGATNSRRARRITGFVFDKSTVFENPMEGIPDTALQCITSLNNPGKRNSHFFAFKTNFGWRLQFLVLGGNYIMSKMTFDINKRRGITFEKFPSLKKGDDEIGRKVSTVGTVSSLFEGDDIVQVKRVAEPIKDYRTGKVIPGYHMFNNYISGLSGWEPGREYEELQMNCGVERL